MATTEDKRGLEGGADDWKRELYDATPERPDELSSTISGLENEPLYTPETVDVDYERDLGYPGVYPFTRGVYPSMYRGKLWTMRQFAGFGTAEETNERFRYLLEHGQTGLSTAFDMPSLMGYDSDHERSLGEVGREGVAIDSLADMETLFSGIPLGEVSTSMTINSPAAMLLAFYVCVGEQQGVPRAELRGTIQTDILKEYIAQKEWIFPPEPSMRLVVDMIEFCAQEMPRWHPISISGYHIREAGSNAVQELAFTLADGFAYVEAAIERGLDVDDFAPRLSFFFNAHLDFFEEIAKYRAARRIWARELRETYGAKNPRSWLMRFHTQTAGVSLTAQQPEVNIVRTALEALAAVLGGTQSLHTNSFDEALALPTENAVRIALRTQQVIAHETGVVNTIDPLGGSWYVEDLTNRLEAEAYDYFARIRQLGGVIPAIEENFFQREIADASFRYQSEVEAKQRVVVGVNRYEAQDEAPIELLAGRPGPRAEADRARAGDAGEAGQRKGRSRARRAEGGRCEGRREPDAADRRRVTRVRDDGRDVRRAPRGVGRVARNARLLTAAKPVRPTLGGEDVPPATRGERIAQLHAEQHRNCADFAATPLDVELEPVVRLLEAGVERELLRAMRQQEPLRPRRLERGHGLLGGQMPPRLAVQLAALQRRLAQEEINSLGQLRQPITRPRVARVRERPRRVRDAEPERLHRVVRKPGRDELQPRRLELLALGVLLGLEHADEHVRRAEPHSERG